MPITVTFLEIKADNVACCLQEARMKLNGALGNTTLDFSSVRRIDPQGLRAMEELIDLAEEKAVKIAVHGVNVDIYKVLKLVKLASRLNFVGHENGRGRPAKEERGHAEPTQH